MPSRAGVHAVRYNGALGLEAALRVSAAPHGQTVGRFIAKLLFTRKLENKITTQANNFYLVPALILPPSSSISSI